jgi:hypothetical protein
MDGHPYGVIMAPGGPQPGVRGHPIYIGTSSESGYDSDAEAISAEEGTVVSVYVTNNLRAVLAVRNL